MKALSLSSIYNIAKDCPDFEEFEQLIKVQLTGEPITVVIDCNPVVIDSKSLNKEKLYGDFFLWFRRNGEKYTGVSIEKMIKIYIKQSS